MAWLACLVILALSCRTGRTGRLAVPVSGMARALATVVGLCGLNHFFDTLARYPPLYRSGSHAVTITGAALCWTAWTFRCRFLVSSPELEEQKNAEKDRAFLATIVESSHDSIIGKDLDGIISSRNVGAERLFGYTAAEVIGRSITLLMPTDRRGEEESILAKLHARRMRGPLRVGAVDQ